MYILPFRAPAEVNELTAMHSASPPGWIFLEWTVAKRAVKCGVYRGQLPVAGGAWFYPVTGRNLLGEGSPAAETPFHVLDEQCP